MKHTITFNLPDDKPDLMLAMYADKFHSALHDIQAEIRNKLKHGEPSEETREILEALREMIPTEFWEVND